MTSCAGPGCRHIRGKPLRRRSLFTQRRTEPSSPIGGSRLSTLAPDALEDIDERYAQIIARGHRQSSPSTQRTGARGPIARSKAANLLRRLDEHRHEALRFTTDLRVPFDNNQAERDIRMVKLQQKISGCWRTLVGAQRYLKVRSYISTARKQGQNSLDVLCRLFEGNAWMPTTQTT